MTETLTIEKVLMTIDAAGGEILAIVTYAAPAGGCGIARNGEALPEHRWPLDNMDACVAAFLRLAKL